MPINFLSIKYKKRQNLDSKTENESIPTTKLKIKSRKLSKMDIQI